MSRRQDRKGRRAAWLLTAALTPAPAEVFAVELDWEVAAGAEERGNFFQAPSGQPREDVFAATVEGVLRAVLDDARRWRLRAAIKHWEYEEELDSADRGLVAADFHDGPHRAHLGVVLDRDRPTVSVGDEFDRADRTRWRGAYSYELRGGWELGGRGEIGDESFELSDDKESDLSAVGLFVRHRGWGSVFSPELSFETGERDVVDPDEDYDQDEVALHLRSAPTEALYLAFRYRQRQRDYTGSDPAASNFGREDDRWDVALTAQYRFTEHWGGTFYGAYQDADSTKAFRVFDDRLLAVWVSYRF